MRRPVLIALGSAATLYGIVCIWLYLAQRSMLYHPTPYFQPGEGESVSLATDDAVLNLWVLRRPARSALIYFGGNAEVVGASLAEYAHAMPGRTMVFVNYRGYGGSTGRPREAALVADALAIFDFLRRDCDDIAVVGRSLGGGVAVQLAAQRPLSKLVLVTPFDSLVRVGQRLFPWLPVTALARDRFESMRFAPRIACPVLVLIAAADEAIPPSHARALAASLPAGRARALEVGGAGHNDIQLWPRFYAEIADFIEGRVMRAGAPS
jgi:pimeloyl-ACP methyl ester carboxylesterase